MIIAVDRVVRFPGVDLAAQTVDQIEIIRLALLGFLLGDRRLAEQIDGEGQRLRRSLATASSASSRFEPAMNLRARCSAERYAVFASRRPKKP